MANQSTFPGQPVAIFSAISLKRLAVLLAVMMISAAGLFAQQANQSSEFVTRSGSSLLVAGKTFRYSGPNIEWLGLVGYGPHDPMGPRYTPAILKLMTHSIRRKKWARG